MAYEAGQARRPSLKEPDLYRLAQAWHDIDPCLTYRDATAAAIKTGPDAIQELFGTTLQFGTAGLRGQMGPGPGAMNRVMVRTVAAALGELVLARGGSQVAIGFDGRHQSDEFALDTARVLAHMGVTALLIDQPTPTPVLAFAVRTLSADAGVMVTASHNPRTDNGYKVYGSDGAILTPPLDGELAELVSTRPLFGDEGLANETHPQIVAITDSLINEYIEQAVSLLDAGATRSVRVAYTPLHGVGHETLARAFERAGFAAPLVVAEQQEPDGDFPTVPFPNPEEPGALRQLFEIASAVDADVALANDPDADRLAVAVPLASSWRLLTGDELGCLLAQFLLERSGRETDRLVLNTIVSSRLLGSIAAEHGARHFQSLTGFKWIMHAQANALDADFIMGYEEALGYAIGSNVRDKDGISAALVVTEMVGELATQGMTLLDALDDLHLRHGVHVTGQRSVRFEAAGPSADEVMDWLRYAPPDSIGQAAILTIDDLATDQGSLPSTNALVFHVDGAKITIRPSGTEAKLKIYGECWRNIPASVPAMRTDRDDAHRQLASLLNAVASHACDPERSIASKLSIDHVDLGADIAERAEELAANQPTTIAREQALRLIIDSIDLTTLAGDDTDGRVRALCGQARRPDPADPTVGPTAAICVYPNLVPIAVELTKGSGVAVASVAGAFPSGLSSLEVRLSDIAEAVCAGANEIDVVLNRAALVAGHDDVVLDELHAMRQQVGSRAMKVILEVSELQTPAAIYRAAKLAMRAGADWIKTSTGKSATGATPTAVMVMAVAIADHLKRTGDPVGLKISGGVRSSAQALGYLTIIEATLGPEWLNPNRLRFGASGLLTAVVDDLAR